MAIKLIAIDIDGTLLNEKNELAEETISTIKEARQQGIKVVLCTGRPLSGVSPYLKSLGISGDDEYVITFNGAMAQTVSGKVLNHHTLSSDDFIDIEAEARKLGSNFQIETSDFIYTPNKDISIYTIYESYLVTMPIRYREVSEMPKDLTISKAMFVDHEEVISAIKDKVISRLGNRYYVVQSEPFFIEIMNKEASKGSALDSLANQLGLSSENVMAIGDQGNDLSMIQYAGLGVAMGNAIPEIKEVAQFETKTNAENGVAYAIQQYGLK